MWRTVEAAGSAIGLAVVVPVFAILRGGSAGAAVVLVVFDEANETGRLAGTTWRGSALFGAAVDVDGPGTGWSSYAMDICFSLTWGLWEKRQFGREHDWRRGQGVLWKRPREENMAGAVASSRRVASRPPGRFLFSLPRPCPRKLTKFEKAEVVLARSPSSACPFYLTYPTH